MSLTNNTGKTAPYTPRLTHVVLQHLPPAEQDVLNSSGYQQEWRLASARTTRQSSTGIDSTLIFAHRFGSFDPGSAAAGVQPHQHHQQQQAFGSFAASQPLCGGAGAAGEEGEVLALLQQQLQLAEVRLDPGRSQGLQLKPLQHSVPVTSPQCWKLQGA